MENMKKSSIYIKLGYVGIFIVVFLVSVYMMLPYEKARDYLQVKFSDMTDTDVTISKLDFSLFSGIKINGVSIKKDISGVPSELLFIDELTVGNYYTLFMPLKKSFSFDIKLYSGSINGTLEFGDKLMLPGNLNLKLKDIDISKNSLLKKQYGVDASGMMAGGIQLNILNKGFMDIDGKVHLSVNNGAIKGMNVDKLWSSMARYGYTKIPDFAFSTINVDLLKKQKSLKLVNAKIDGNDMNINASGNINLSRTLRLSAMSISVGISSKDDDDVYTIKLEGPIGNPRIKL